MDTPQSERYIVQRSDDGWDVIDTETGSASDYNRGLDQLSADTICRYFNDGRCPVCPAEPLKPRRSRCPTCKEWISYTPKHTGHKIPLMERGKLRWRKPAFKPVGLAWIGHMNTHRETHSGQAFIDTFYEPVSQGSN